MRNEAYPIALVRRLLVAWPELRYGLYPTDRTGPTGYRGRRAAPIGGFEVAIEACADLELAVRRLPGDLAAVTVRRFLEGHKRAPGEPRFHELVHAVWLALNYYGEEEDEDAGA